MAVHANRTRESESGMLLIEALVAMVIVAMVTIAYIGIRTTALIDATRARNWRLAREIAEEKEAVQQFGSSDSGASLGDILGEALKKGESLRGLAHPGEPPRRCSFASQRAPADARSRFDCRDQEAGLPTNP